ncbi:MAG: hypothetical protein Q9187_006275, partial [Circinaria calcarea]
MSLPSTPDSPMEGSIASSPGPELSRVPMDQLTPRSKVKSMLAALDDSDSNGESRESSRALGSARKRVVEFLQKAEDTIAERRGGAITAIPESGAEEDIHEDDIVAPRGKLAARLHGQPTTTAGKAESGKDPSANAYERVKQQLLQKPQQSVRATSEDSVTSNGLDQEVPTTRKLLRGKRPKAIASDSEASSILTPEQRKPSPGLFLTPEEPQLAEKPTIVIDPSGLFLTPEEPKLANKPSNRSDSSGLFLTSTPTKASAPTEVQDQSNGSDSDLPLEPQAKSRFLALVARKREERQARDAVEKKKTEDRKALRDAHSETNGAEGTIGTSEEDSEGEVAAGRKLTQQARPSRKASKKALEEMNRETQRMSRNMQLAHQAKTKKKITKESLLARFNFRCNPTPPATDVQEASSSIRGSSAPVSDVEGMKDHETPPTSPAMPDNSLPKLGAVDPKTSRDYVVSKLSDDIEDDLPSMEDVMAISGARNSKGKAKATEDIFSDPIEDFPSAEDMRAQSVIHSDKNKDKPIANDKPVPIHKPRKPTFTQPPIRIKPPKTTTRRTSPDSDNDLEILPVSKYRKSRRLDVLDCLPAQKTAENRSLQTLRALAHLTSPSEQGSKSKSSITPAEMQMSLQKRARQQAARERAEKIQELKDRGIIVQSTEERERDQAEVENLLEKARREADEITKKEKDAAKKEQGENGNEGGLEDSSDEDEEYKDDETEALEVESSESEGEDGHDAHDDSEEERSNEEDEEAIAVGVKLLPRPGDLIDNKASKDGAVDRLLYEGEDNDREETPERRLHNRMSRRRNKINHVVDEEDGEDSSLENDPASSGPFENPMVPNLHGSNDAPMGLTQAFAATMADSQTQIHVDPGESDQEQDSLAFLRGMPEPGFPMIDADAMILDSQPALGSAEIELHLSQSQIDHVVATQCSELPDPSQDVGFRLSSPINTRFVSVPSSTVDTVVLSATAEDETVGEEVIVKKKGQLRRRAEAVANLSKEDKERVVLGIQNEQFEISANAFDVLKQAHRRPPPKTELFDRTKSDAKGMVEEQAEESEDEYAGLGGASDEGSGGEEDEDVRKMIDEGEVKVDERKLAAFYADKERASDEKAVEKLFKDIKNGMLRRKRGAEFDLSDSDDDVEARRRRKRQQFAKIQKALCENENVRKIVKDPKKVAFLRAIEDRENDEDIDFLEQPDQGSDQIMADTQEESQSQDSPATMPETAIGARSKRPLQLSMPDAANANRPAAPVRRAQKIKKPSTLAEIRESVSFLIEEPDAMPLQAPSTDLSSEEEENAENPQSDTQRNNFSSRHTANPIIDRLSLKRAASTSLSSSSSSSSSSRLAFINPTHPTTHPGFRVPSLLRRATTQNFASAADANGISTLAATTERAAGGGE